MTEKLTKIDEDTLEVEITTKMTLSKNELLLDKEKLNRDIGKANDLIANIDLKLNALK